MQTSTATRSKSDANEIAARAGLNVPSDVHDFVTRGEEGCALRPMFVHCRRCKYQLYASGKVRRAGNGACEE